MKKCVVISCFNYYEIRTKRIIEFLEGKQFDTTYIISDFNHYSKKKEEVNLPKTIQLKVPAYKKNLSVKRLLSHWLFSRKTYRKLKQIKPDVIYCMFPPNTLVKKAVQYKRKHSVQLIFDCYDMWPESFPYNKDSKLLAFPFKKWRNLREKYIAEADRIICVSKNGEELLKKTHPNLNTHIMFPSLSPGDLARRKKLENDSLTFCYLGMINHITDIELGVKLLSALSLKKKISLHLIGEGQNKEVFINSLRQAGVEVIEHGVVFDMEKKNEIFSQCDFGLNIPRKEINSSMPLKAVEYMRAGLPFVNSGVGEIQEIVKNGMIGIDIDIDDINSTVNYLSSIDESLMQSLRQNCIDLYQEKFIFNNDLEAIL